jgi:hypothetical protein
MSAQGMLFFIKESLNPIVQIPPAPNAASASPTPPLSQAEIEKIHSLVLDLASVERREQVRY